MSGELLQWEVQELVETHVIRRHGDNYRRSVATTAARRVIHDILDKCARITERKMPDDGPHFGKTEIVVAFSIGTRDHTDALEAQLETARAEGRAQVAAALTVAAERYKTGGDGMCKWVLADALATEARKALEGYK